MKNIDTLNKFLLHLDEEDKYSSDILGKCTFTQEENIANNTFTCTTCNKEKTGNNFKLSLSNLVVGKGKANLVCSSCIGNKANRTNNQGNRYDRVTRLEKALMRRTE